MSSKAKPSLAIPKGFDRFGRADGALPKIDRTGGRFGAGIIRGVSLASVGEALGHEYWLDAETIKQVAEYSKAKESGLKARFTHPGMSSDGMGRFLGRIHDVKVMGDKAVGDLHFAESSHSTPDGDLAEYVMTLVEEDPASAGLSIVFQHDMEAEDIFSSENESGSPDPNNAKNYPHVRIAELRAADIVDEPAANPSGMFDTESLPREMDDLLSYAAGISSEKPEATAFGVDGDRASQFLRRWLDSHGLSLTTKDAIMADENKTETSLTEQTTNAPSIEDFRAELSKFTAKFGTENGTKWFTENKTYSEAIELHVEALGKQIESEKAAREEAENRLSSLALGETSPLETGASDVTKPKRKFAEVVGVKKN